MNVKNDPGLFKKFLGTRDLTESAAYRSAPTLASFLGALFFVLDVMTIGRSYTLPLALLYAPLRVLPLFFAALGACVFFRELKRKEDKRRYKIGMFIPMSVNIAILIFYALSPALMLVTLILSVFFLG